jgi:hypothetical protein
MKEQSEEEVRDFAGDRVRAAGEVPEPGELPHGHPAEADLRAHQHAPGTSLTQIKRELDEMTAAEEQGRSKKREYYDSQNKFLKQGIESISNNLVQQDVDN